MSAPENDTYATAQAVNAHWRDMYLQLVESWSAVCDTAGVQGDSSPAEVVAAIIATERAHLEGVIAELMGVEGLADQASERLRKASATLAAIVNGEAS